jgi:hypothetical protein
MASPCSAPNSGTNSNKLQRVMPLSLSCCWIASKKVIRQPKRRFASQEVRECNYPIGKGKAPYGSPANTTSEAFSF